MLNANAIKNWIVLLKLIKFMCAYVKIFNTFIPYFDMTNIYKFFYKSVHHVESKNKISGKLQPLCKVVPLKEV